MSLPNRSGVYWLFDHPAFGESTDYLTIQHLEASLLCSGFVAPDSYFEEHHIQHLEASLLCSGFVAPDSYFEEHHIHC
jgi:hypothetical protein